MKVILLIMILTAGNPPKRYAMASVYDTMEKCLEDSKDYKIMYYKTMAPADAIECIELNKKEK